MNNFILLSAKFFDVQNINIYSILVSILFLLYSVDFISAFFCLFYQCNNPKSLILALSGICMTAAAMQTRKIEAVIIFLISIITNNFMLFMLFITIYIVTDELLAKIYRFEKKKNTNNAII